MQLDKLDNTILNLLSEDGRLTNVELAQKVGLSPSACSRRVQALEQAGILRGYRAIIDPQARGMAIQVILEITLKGQEDSYLTAFEEAVSDCPNVISCDLMSGASDYILRVGARDLADFERLHREVFSRLPGVARMISNFALRQII